MAGYYGFSMSNNAVSAYEDGEKPISKWKKKDILDEIKKGASNGEISLQCSLDSLKKVPAPVLKKVCLYNSSYHHVSKYYNVVDFYSLDVDQIEDLTEEQLDRMVREHRQEQEKLKHEREHEEKCECTFLEWTGSRNHPKSTEVTEIGIIRGNWFIRSNGHKKKITARGFKIIRKVD